MNTSICFEGLDSVTELGSTELTTINGGGFWGDVFYGIGATAHFLVYAVKDAVAHPIRPSEYR